MGVFGAFKEASSAAATAGALALTSGAIGLTSGAIALTAGAIAAFPAAANVEPCAASIQRRLVAPAQLVAPPQAGPRQAGSLQGGPLQGGPLHGGAAASLPGYAGALATTALGWPVLPHWCVWIEPGASGVSADPASGAAREQARWQQAMAAAVAAWQSLLPIHLVTDGEAAQVRIWRRRPPLRMGADGRSRASHGRALLQLLAVERQPGRWRLEPAVAVLIGPGQRREALQATAVHELGHAFGLWGHSSDPADALAAAPGAVPVLVPSARDRATMSWLRRQSTRFGAFLAVPPGPGAPRAGASAGEEATAAGEGQGAEEAQQLHRHHGGT